MKLLLSKIGTVGCNVAIAAFLTFLPSVSFALPMILDLNASVTSNSITPLDPFPPFTSGDYYPRMKTVAVGDEITVRTFLNTDLDFFFGSGSLFDQGTGIYRDAGPILSFTAFDVFGEVLGGDSAIAAQLTKRGTKLSGSTLSGPADFDLDFDLDISTGLGRFVISGAGGGIEYDGALTAAIECANLSVKLGNPKDTAAAVSESTNTLVLLVLGAAAVGVASKFLKRDPSHKKRALNSA